MEPDKEKDITRLMAEALRKQKLPYREGAWERFKEFEAERKGRKVLWPYFSAVAAAALLVMGVLITVNQNDLPSSADVVRTNVSIPQNRESFVPEARGNNKKVDSEGLTNQSTHPDRQYLAYSTPVSRSSELSAYAASEGLPEGSKAADAASYPQAAEAASVVESSETESSAKSYLPANPSEKNAVRDVQISTNSYDALVQRAPESAFDSDNDSRWSFSVELSPNIKNKEINMGGGVAVSYALSDRISISSGLSYVALDAQRGPTQRDIPQEFAKTSLSNYNYNKSLSHINTSLVGLDIPLNVRFQVNQKVYASAGVSVFNVLEESRYNQFEEHVAVLAFTGNKDGSGSPEPVMQTLRTQEVSEETPYQGKNFTGFFNLSVGYQLPVLKKLNLAVEPYIKVPIGTLSEQDMDLSNGGLKIITTF